MLAGRRFAFLGAAGMVLVLLLALLHWRDVLVAYHLTALRRDPSQMTAWIQEPEDSPRGMALRRYLRTGPGVRELRRRTVESALAVLASDHREFLPQALDENEIVQFGLYELVGGLWLLADGPTTVSLTVPPESEVRALAPLLEFVESGAFEVEEYPGVDFTVWSFREAGTEERVALECRMARRSPPAATFTER